VGQAFDQTCYFYHKYLTKFRANDVDADLDHFGEKVLKVLRSLGSIKRYK